MKMTDIPFGLTNWDDVEVTEVNGVTGKALIRAQQFGEIRVRMVEYTPGYVADHWCNKGHILLVLEGVLVTELQEGSTVTLTPGVSYQVADDAEPHRSRTNTGAKLFIVD